MARCSGARRGLRAVALLMALCAASAGRDILGSSKSEGRVGTAASVSGGAPDDCWLTFTCAVGWYSGGARRLAL